MTRTEDRPAEHFRLLTADDIEARRSVWYGVVVKALGVSFFAVCTGWSAAFKIPLGFTPVPITLQTMPVLMSGAVMGSGLGTISMLVYVLLGCLGLPFFSGMRSGVGMLFGSTGGYIFGFVIASWMIGKIAHRREFSPGRFLLALAAGSATIYAFGVLGLMSALSSGFPTAFNIGVKPFIVGDVIKLGAALGLLRVTHSWTQRFFCGGEERGGL